jgi:hypothetical protein
MVINYLGYGKPLFIEDEGGLCYAMIMNYLGRLVTQNKILLIINRYKDVLIRAVLAVPC